MQYIEGITAVEAKKIIAIVKEKFNHDFSSYSFTSFRRRVAIANKNLNIFNIDNLIDRLMSESYFFDLFIKEISVPATEMFRDPSAWKFLGDYVLPKLFNNKDQVQIWIPECVTGQEIFTLSILLKELNLYNRAKIYSNFCSNSLIKSFKTSGYDLKKMEFNKANYLRYNESGDFSKYYRIENFRAYFNSELLANVVIEKYFLTQMLNPFKIDLIIYRNKFLYYNLAHQTEILELLTSSLDLNGYLFIGSKENAPDYKKHYKLISEQERIFKKISK